MRNSKGQFIDGEAGKNTRFTRERSLGNKHAKGNPKNKTTFGVRDVRMEKHPKWKGGLNKTTRDGFVVNLGNGKRIPLSRKIWIDAYGEIPDGYVIIHKDGKANNNKLSNLDCISRADNLRKNRKW